MRFDVAGIAHVGIAWPIATVMMILCNLSLGFTCLMMLNNQFATSIGYLTPGEWLYRYFIQLIGGFPGLV